MAIVGHSEGSGVKVIFFEVRDEEAHTMSTGFSVIVS